MALKQLVFKPGVNRESTSYAAEGTWYTCDKIRFRSNKPEKIGGWKPLTSTTFVGTARTMWNWVTNSGFNNLGIGTNLKYYVENGTVYNDITPLRGTALSTNPLTTTSGSLTVVVAQTAHGLLTGDTVRIANVTGFNGLSSGSLNGSFVITVINANSYSYVSTSTTAATASGAGGGVSVYATYRFRLSTTIAPFQTTSGSTTVTVTHDNHGASTGDFVVFYDAVTVNGVTEAVLERPTGFQITYLTANTYNITVPTAATSSGLGGGLTVKAEYQISVGNSVATLSSGWGAGTWGGLSTPPAPNSGWGASAATGVSSPLRLWNAHNYGQNLVYGPRGGGIYYWDASNLPTNFNNRGVLASSLTGASDVPLFQNELLVSDTSRFVICFGTNDIGSTTLDPLLIRWSDQENITNWTPAITNQAGGIRLSSGSKIIAAVSTKQEIVVFTDSAVYSMQYVGPPYVFNLSQIADNVSIMSPHSFAVANNIVYWMGLDKFYMYSGRVETLPCSLRSYVFSTIGLDQRDQVICGTNEGFTEVWWFYCSNNDQSVPNRYVVFNHLDRAWYYGTMQRTAWLDSGLRQWPMAVQSNRVLNHENGTDDETVFPAAPINAYIESADFDIDDGDKLAFCWRMLPDITFVNSEPVEGFSPSVTVVVKPRDYPGAPYKTEFPSAVVSGEISPPAAPPETYTNDLSVTGNLHYPVYLRFRGRQMAFRIESNTVGTQWQLGVPRIDIRSDGRKS
jgi:hypothetical protein